VPAVTDLGLMRQLRCTWQELQDMPAERLEVWKAVWRGEGSVRGERAMRK